MKTAIVLGLSALILLGCGAARPDPPANPAIVVEPGITEITHKLKNGRTITCLLWNRDAGYDSGMSCDWANAK